MDAINDQTSRPIKLVYLIGTYPGLTNTFIDREIATLRQLGDFQIQIVSLRYPRPLDVCSPEQKALGQETLYLMPPHEAALNYPAFLWANVYFVFSRPRVYFSTLLELLRHSPAGVNTWLMALLYFWQGVYAAYLLRRTDFDHVHVHFMDRAVLVALVVSRFLGKSYSFTAHAADIFTKAVLVRDKIDQARFMITVSQYNKQHLLSTYPGVNADKIHILHPWVDVAQFTPRAERPRHERLHILSVGRLVEKKGHLDLIDAVQALRVGGVETDCRIVGAGPLHADLAQRIARHDLQDRVQLLGGLPQAGVVSLLRDWADVFVLPCLIARNGDRDGIPVSLAEAMAMELPVISTDIVGIRELVQAGTGLLVPPHDPAALAEALRTIAVQGPLVSTRMGRQGRAVVDQEFNLLKGTQELAGYFYQAVGKVGAAGGERMSYGSK
jgi:colanic acid/amylovoran biosynthesis glycosyltransferase